MIKFYYSAKNNAFYAASDMSAFKQRNAWPDDALLLTDDEVDRYTRHTPTGKMFVPGRDGRPEWVDIPPPTPEQLQQQAESQKRQLLTEAKEKIDIWQDAVDLDMVTKEEKAALFKWKKYRVLLNRVDCTPAPDIDWPEQPA